MSLSATDWPDYVFGSSYQLPSPGTVAQYVKQNKHLPDVPSAAAIEKEGLDLGDMQKQLLKKMEEITLYVIEQEQKLKARKFVFRS